VPTLNEENVRHLVRRTEVVDRQERVDALLALDSIADAVDDVMNVSGSVSSATFAGIDRDDDYSRGIRIGEHWMDQMASTARPFGERMAFFWHGHICSGLGKVGDAGLMQEQIDLFRRSGLGTASNSGSVRDLMIDMSTQAAMIIYLDNDRNEADSPNQNFARELIELFLIGVGNYTEADVEAATAAWTGHTARYPDRRYEFDADVHEAAPQDFLGVRINEGAARDAGRETVDVVLGTGSGDTGTVPVGANAGRSTAEVAAEFLSKKLWQEFGEATTGSVPDGVLADMSAALVDSSFDIRAWVRAMLVHDDFYTDEVKSGLVRQPVEYVVALMVATGLDAERGASFWLLERAGQRLLYPPNVSGWKPNGYWVNASAMGARQRIAQGYIWELTGREWHDDDDAFFPLGTGRVRKQWLHDRDLSGDAIVDELLRLTGLGTSVSISTRQRLIDHIDDPEIEFWHRLDALLLLLSAPEMHAA